MISSNQIKADASVVCSKNIEFGVVDHMEGTDAIKLKKDKQGQHHFIPLSWVSKVDDKVHIDRSGEQAMKEWTTVPKTKTAAPQSAQTSHSAPATDNPKSTGFTPNKGGSESNPQRPRPEAKTEQKQTAR